MKVIQHLLAITFMVMSLPAVADLVGKCVGVHDGDTITVLDADKVQHKIRFALIDAPETKQAFGERSKQSLSSMVYSKMVRVAVKETDHYNREVGVVYVDNLEVNLEQVKRGMAMVYRQYAKDQHAYAAYYTAEEQAKSSRTGLWSDPNPVPPWDFRHGTQQGATNSSNTFPTVNRNPEAAYRGPHTTGDCGSKHRCSEMASCDEAKHYLNDCHVSSLDGDGDGVPCNKLCR